MIPRLKFYVTLKSGEKIEVYIDELHKYNNLKKILCKEHFDYLFFDLGYSREDFSKVNLGSKAFINSYHRWYTEEERRIIHGQKISKSLRKNNFNLRNKGKLRVILDKNLLEQCIEERISLNKMSAIFNVAPQTVKANLESLNHSYINQTLRSDTVADIKYLDSFCETNLLDELISTKAVEKTEEDIIKIRTLVHRMELTLSSMQETLNKIRYKYSLGGTANTRNRYEKYIMEYLMDEGIMFIPQHRIEKYSYDIYVPSLNLLIESDGTGHNRKTDDIKESLAKEQGYAFKRFNFNKWKNKKKCKHLVQLEISKLLESK